MAPFSSPGLPAHPLRNRVLVLAGIAGIGLYAALIIFHVAAVPGGADSAGYFIHARMLASATVHAQARELPGLPAAAAPGYLYVPLGLKPAPKGPGLVPYYSTGFPLLMVAAEHLVGWRHSADFVLVLHGVLGLVLTWLLASALGMPTSWAIVAMAILAASPLYLMYSLQAMSDVPAMVWVTAAVLASLYAIDRERWALAAGAAFAGAVLIRPANVLGLAPLAIALSWPSRGWPGALRRWLWFGLGGLPGATFFMLDSRAAYGQWLGTGYGTLGPDFGFKWVMVTLAHDAHWLPILFTPVIVFVFALRWEGRLGPRICAVLGAWILAYVAFYSVYRFTHESWWYLRFLLPIGPALIVGGLMGLRRILPGRVVGLRPLIPLTLGMCAVLLAGHHWSRRLYALSIPDQENIYLETTGWLKANLPANAVVLCMQTSGAVYYDTNFAILRWDEINRGSLATVMAPLQASRRPLYAALYPFEVEPALKERVPGRWTQVGKVGIATIWRRDPE